MRIGRPFSKRHKVGDILSSKNCGDFKIVEVNSSIDILCEFLATGYRVRTQATHIRMGGVKDPMAPIIFGVGFSGVGDFYPSKHKRHYQRWKNMLTRCYDPVYQSKNPTYKGCSVHTEWHNFQNFAKWHDENFPNDGGRYEIDKDIKVKGNKVYGPDTCIFTTRERNNEEAKCRWSKIVSPDGVVYDVFNMSEFGREHDLIPSKISMVLSGKRKSHKGWKACTN